MNIPLKQVHPPWYRQFWPWVLIAIPFLTVVASGITFWLALSHPDTLVVDPVSYKELRQELRAQPSNETTAPASDPEPADGEP